MQIGLRRFINRMKSITNINIIIRDILLVLLIIFLSQGFLFPKGSLIAHISILLYLFICVAYFVKVMLLRHNPSLVILFAVFLVIQLLYCIIGIGTIYTTTSGAAVTPFSMFKIVAVVFLTFFPFYYFSLKGIISQNFLLRFFVIYSFVSMGQFYSNYFLLSDEYGSNDLVNNSAYNVLSLFPFVFLIKGKKWLTTTIIFIFLLVIISSIKRGPIIIASCVVLIFFIFTIKQNRKSNHTLTFLYAILSLCLIGIAIYHIFGNNEYLMYRYETTMGGSSSGRDMIYANILNFWWQDSSLFHYLFGNGLFYSVKIAGNAAHNDWLELLINCGLLGVILYMAIFKSLYSLIKRTKDISAKYITLILTVIWFLTSLYSMGYYDLCLCPSMILLGYLIANGNK